MDAMAMTQPSCLETMEGNFCLLLFDFLWGLFQEVDDRDEDGEEGEAAGHEPLEEGEALFEGFKPDVHGLEPLIHLLSRRYTYTDFSNFPLYKVIITNEGELRESGLFLLLEISK